VAIGGILFDKDGTIVDYWKTWLPLNRAAALYAARGNRRLADDLLRLGGHDPASDTIIPGSPLAAGAVADIAAAFTAHPEADPPADLVAGLECIFREGGAHSVLVKGAREAIVELERRGFRLGVASNDSAAGIAASLGRHDILGSFAFVAGYDSGHGTKPDPRLVLAFCRHVGLAPWNVAVVGDAVHDLVMARSAGAALAIGVLTGTSRQDELEPCADLVLGSIGDLLPLSAFAAAG
jgi:phosphoglycolate phosphatase